MKSNTLTFNNLRHVRLLFSLLTLAAFFTACDTEEEPIPTYLEIEPFEMLSINPGTHGSVSSKITNAQVFFTDQADNSIHSLGTVSLPAKLPVLATGLQEINVFPVIKANGNSLYLQVYPFYERFTQMLDLPPNGDVTVKPKTQYVDNAKFEFIEDFEGTGHLFTQDRDDNPLTSVERSADDVFEGAFSGKIRLDTQNFVIVAATDQVFQIDFQSAGKIFMEVNYKTDVPIEFGVLALNNLNEESPNFEFVVLEKDEWNKIYFDMTEILTTSSENRFVFIFRAGLPFENGKFTLNEAFIYLDNIKVVHF